MAGVRSHAGFAAALLATLLRGAGLAWEIVGLVFAVRLSKRYNMTFGVFYAAVSTISASFRYVTPLIISLPVYMGSCNRWSGNYYIFNEMGIYC